MMLAAVGLAAAVTYGIEQPAMRWLRGWWERPNFRQLRSRPAST
jgi:hypothetical protein